MPTNTKTAAKKKAAARKPAVKKTTTAPPASVSDYRPQLPMTQIVKHPKNPRHSATADVELVDSVKASGIVQPLIVAPYLGDTGIEVPDKYVLIAGHRRLDAARKARAKTVPAVIRRDLVEEGLQIEAMLIENGRRKDLTPIEEAEGYAQLELIGYKPPAIAKAVGRDVKTVKSRLQLLKLSASTRKRVHAGQLHLADAAALTEFADDPVASHRLEEAAKRNDGWSFKNELHAARRRRGQARDVAARTAKLLDAGATQVPYDEETGYHAMLGADLAELSRTHSVDWGQHKGCLAFVTYDSQYAGPQLHEVCTKPGSHRAQLAAESRKRLKEAEDREKAAEQRSLAEAAAADRRVETLMRLTEGAALPDVIGDLARVLLPARVRALGGPALGAYQQAMGIPIPDRWGFLGYYHVKPVDLTRFTQHVEDLVAGGNTTAARALAAYLIAAGEAANDRTHELSEHETALDYFTLLADAGHDMSDIDTEQRETHQQAVDEAEKKAS